MACQQPVREADPWNRLFQRTQGYGWSGGDGAYSVSLPASRTLWLFGDSILSGVEGQNRSAAENRFGNTIAIQNNPAPGEDPLGPGSIRFDWGPVGSSGWLPIFDETLNDPAVPESLRRAEAEQRPLAAWPLHGIVIGADLLLFNAVATSGSCENCGLFNFEVHGSTLSVVRGVDRPYDQWGFRTGVGWQDDSRPEQHFVAPGRHPTGAGRGLLWGTYVVTDPADRSSLFVYGHMTHGDSDELVVARATGVSTAGAASEFQNWSYWTGAEWSADPESAGGILSQSAVEVSVSPVPESVGSGWVVVHGGMDLAGLVHVALGASPTGPFRERYVFSLYDCPITGFDTQKRFVAYAIKAHPELSAEDELLVSLVLVPVEPGATATLARTGHYVPRFLRLPWDEVMNHSRSSASRCEGSSSSS